MSYEYDTILEQCQRFPATVLTCGFTILIPFFLCVTLSATSTAIETHWTSGYQLSAEGQIWGHNVFRLDNDVRVSSTARLRAAVRWSAVFIGSVVMSFIMIVLL